MKIGQGVRLKQGRHKDHIVVLGRIEDDTAYWECSCGSTWHNAWDPEGNLGSEEAPEG